ncbi:MAG: ATP-binding protein, partial [Chthoniobacterales bacterium]
RRQPGTPSLRAILYIDEIFGYLPPIANPPSKGPLLLLLKQARAFGLGILVATQNPADLDYKALANCGTWFIGRLQTDRDKQRVLEGLESASAGRGADRAALMDRLNALGKRIFLLNSVHLPAPITFTTRWTMSYLRGPLTREQIRVLMQGAARPSAKIPPPTETPASTETLSSGATTPAPPTAEPGVWQLVVDGNAGTLVPSLGLRARGSFACKRPAAECSCEFLVSVPLGADGKPMWKNAIVAGAVDDATPPVPHGGPHYAATNPELLKAAAQSTWQLEARQNLGETLEVSVQKSGQVTGAPFEDENEFRLRLEQAGREDRDEAVRKLREKYSAKTRATAQKVARAQEAVAQQQAQARSAQMQTAISMGSTLLGAFLGKGRSKLGHMSRASTAARG